MLFDVCWVCVKVKEEKKAFNLVGLFRVSRCLPETSNRKLMIPATSAERY